MRLPSCDKWHPDEPSELYSLPYAGRKICAKGTRGGTYVRQFCRACRQHRHMQTKEAQLRNRPYGVLPALNWPAPGGV